ncbi:hypothetical protein B0T10DRAFT_401561 [Thelonectria olida]|uniref:Ketoreductase domain-containing protein n=1 Tax=Thelonectria olida TaxID=1576542 RepID=A0A9P8W971_9HYPO|nr:hypothetical protein B0T10DRAFT_401561 [Thelonectria olida]
MASSRPYNNKLGVVTGGSRGIGAAVAHRLAAKGCNLLLAYSSDPSTVPTEHLCKQLSLEHDIHCRCIQADLQAPDEASRRILQAARELFESYDKDGIFQIDILINNAGVSSNQHLIDENQGSIDRVEFDRVYTVNVLAPPLLTQNLVPHFPTDRSGRIVNVSSVSSSIGYQVQSVYAGSKAAIEAMTRVWSRELSQRATVNAVNAGPAWEDIFTRMVSSACASPAFRLIALFASKPA